MKQVQCRKQQAQTTQENENQCQNRDAVVHQLNSGSIYCRLHGVVSTSLDGHLDCHMLMSPYASQEAQAPSYSTTSHDLNHNTCHLCTFWSFCKTVPLFDFLLGDTLRLKRLSIPIVFQISLGNVFYTASSVQFCNARAVWYNWERPLQPIVASLVLSSFESKGACCKHVETI